MIIFISGCVFTLRVNFCLYKLLVLRSDIMQEIVANVDHITFTIEKMLEQQTGAQALMFPGMDSKWHDFIWQRISPVLYLVLRI